MIDTLKIYITQNQLSADFDETVYPKFKNKQVTKKDTGEIWGTSTFHNFICNHNQWGISITGSISRYYLGTNQYTLTKDDFISAIEQLGQELHVDLKDCSVTRLDIAENIITQEPVENYYRYLGESKGVTRVRMNNGIEYRNTVRTILIYDKTKELKKNRIPVIPIFEGKHILRFECRFMNGDKVAKVLKTHKAKISDLIESYHLLIDEWAVGFKSIFKNYNLTVFNPRAFSGSKEFETQLTLAGINALGGGPYILELIKEARKMKLFKYNNKATNLTRRIKAILQAPVLTQKSTLVEELEKKVKIIGLVFSVYSK